MHGQNHIKFVRQIVRYILQELFGVDTGKRR